MTSAREPLWGPENKIEIKNKKWIKKGWKKNKRGLERVKLKEKKRLNKDKNMYRNNDEIKIIFAFKLIQSKE